MTLPNKIAVTPEMVDAGVDVLSRWKCESDFVSEQQAVREIFEAMIQTNAFHLLMQNPTAHQTGQKFFQQSP